MNQYITGSLIKKCRERNGMTQLELANQLHVSDRTVSKWETGKGYPDITLLEDIAEALKTSVIELLSGENIINQNKSFNMKKVKFYICPVCGNVVVSCGEAVISCCGIQLFPEEIEQLNDHPFTVVKDGDEYYVEGNHPMTHQHYISFLAAVRYDGVELIKLYPEGGCNGRFTIQNTAYILGYCNHHGLFRIQ